MYVQYIYIYMYVCMFNVSETSFEIEVPKVRSTAASVPVRESESGVKR
jgi:hypothetical protein